MDIIRQSWRMSDPIRLLTVTAINLVGETEDEQLSLFDALAGLSPAPDDPARREAAESMERAMDEIRKKYGSSSIGYGAALGSDIGIDL